MRIGSAGHRVVFQVPSESQAATSGFPTDSWSTYATVWARVSPMSGKERWEAQQVQPEITHEIEIRHRKGINPEKRVLIPKETTTLAAAISSTSATSISASESFSTSTSTNYRILIDSELMIVTAGQGGTTWTVTRGADGTTAATHSSGARVTLMGVCEIESVTNPDERNERLILECKENV